MTLSPAALILANMTSQDPHAKQLLVRYPHDTVALFAPELITAHGAVKAITDISSEIFPLDPDGRSGFLDVALACTFADQSQHILLLIEHWSAARKVDHRRVHRYLAELLYRHPRSLVLPIILVTDPRAGPIADHLRYDLAGRQVVDISFVVIQVDAEWRSRLQVQKNVVACVLYVVPDIGPADQRCVDGITGLKAIRETWPSDEIAMLIAHMERFARLTEEQSEQLRCRLREDPDMTSVVERLRDDFRAEGRAEGEIEALLAMVRKGRVSVATAHEQLGEWLDEGDIPQCLYDEARERLAE